MFQQSGMGLWTTFRPAEFRNMTAVLVYLETEEGLMRKIDQKGS